MPPPSGPRFQSAARFSNAGALNHLNLRINSTYPTIPLNIRRVLPFSPKGYAKGVC